MKTRPICGQSIVQSGFGLTFSPVWGFIEVSTKKDLLSFVKSEKEETERVKKGALN